MRSRMSWPCPLCGVSMGKTEKPLRIAASQHKIITHQSLYMTPDKLKRWRDWFDRLPKLRIIR